MLWLNCKVVKSEYESWLKMSTSGGKFRALTQGKFTMRFKRVKYRLIGDDLEVKMVKNENQDFRVFRIGVELF
jgi:hypothetical protein